MNATTLPARDARDARADRLFRYVLGACVVISANLVTLAAGVPYGSVDMLAAFSGRAKNGRKPRSSTSQLLTPTSAGPRTRMPQSP